MEDRYLFKAKQLDNEEWVVGSLISMPHGGYMIDRVADSRRFRVMINPSTICQCTGLKDKKGKLIWENDIIRTKVGTAKVIWDKSEWRIEWLKNDLWRKDLYYWAVEDIQRVVVIGNIFDNAELLESEE